MSNITFTWSFPNFEVQSTENNLTDVVKIVHWRYTASDGTNSTDAYGSISLETPDANTFISYSSITQDQVISWITLTDPNVTDSNKLDVKTLQDNLTAKLVEISNPTIKLTVPPFSATP